MKSRNLIFSGNFKYHTICIIYSGTVPCSGISKSYIIFRANLDILQSMAFNYIMHKLGTSWSW